MPVTSRVARSWMLQLQFMIFLHFCTAAFFWRASVQFSFADGKSISGMFSNTSTSPEYIDPIEPSPRIINGHEAPPMGYPYLAILNQGHVLKCGGVLIAPDIILTAAHCSESVNEAQLGRHNRSDETEVYESLIVEKLITHPRYFRNRFLDADPHDFAIVKLFGQSKKVTPIRINQNPQVPVPDQKMLVFGWGSFDPDDLTKQSDVLRGATAYYMTNEKCKTFVGSYGFHQVDFQRYVINATLCASNFEEQMDSCRGDSGSGLVVQGPALKDDVLVGIVSAGFGCANPTLPALYARVSEVHGWIRDRVCELSVSPPLYFECPTFPFLSMCQNFPIGRDVTPCIEILEPQTRITLELFLDSRPKETGWILRRSTEGGQWVTEVERPILSYENIHSESLFSETLSVTDDRDYELVLLDSYGDINATVKITDEYGNELLSVKESTINGGAKYSVSFPFTVGVPPSSAPTISSPPSVTTAPTLQPTQIMPVVSVVISFDENPENIGFQLQRLINGTNATKEENSIYEPIHNVYPGTFSSDLKGSNVTLKVPLQPKGKEKEIYRFVMTSNEGRGFASGGYEVWLGDPLDGDLLFIGDKFYLEDANTFYFEPKSTEEPSTSPTSLISLDLNTWDDNDTSAMTVSASSSQIGTFAIFSGIIIVSTVLCTA